MRLKIRYWVCLRSPGREFHRWEAWTAKPWSSSVKRCELGTITGVLLEDFKQQSVRPPMTWQITDVKYIWYTVKCLLIAVFLTCKICDVLLMWILMRAGNKFLLLHNEDGLYSSCRESWHHTHKSLSILGLQFNISCADISANSPSAKQHVQLNNDFKNDLLFCPKLSVIFFFYYYYYKEHLILAEMAACETTWVTFISLFNYLLLILLVVRT